MKDVKASESLRQLVIPLQGIGDLAHDLAKTLTTPDDKKKLSAIAQTVELLLLMVEQEKDQSSFDLSCGDFYLKEFMQRLLDVTTGPLKRKKIRPLLVLDHETPEWVNADQLRLQQILYEIFGSLQDSPSLGDSARGEISLKVSFEVGTLIFLVEIGASLLRPGSSLTPQDFLANKIINQVHGSLGITVTATGVTQFRISWPIKRYSSQKVGEERKMRGKILVADDDLSNQAMMQSMLEMLGHECHVVNNGEEVLECLKRASYRLILMDCQMPVMDGYTATKKIRQQEKYQTLPILALTGHDEEIEKQRCLDSGMNDYITKPILMNKLGQQIKKWLKSGAESLDEKVLNRLAQQTSRAVMIKVARSFVLGLDEFLEKSALDLAEKNWVAIKSLAHRFKSSSAMVGAMTFSELCIQIENPHLESQELEKIVGKLQELAQEIKQELEKIIAEEKVS